jgi:Protein kinase domain
MIGSGTYGFVVDTGADAACKVFLGLGEHHPPFKKNADVRMICGPSPLATRRPRRELDAFVVVEMTALKLMEQCPHVIHASRVERVQIHGFKASRLSYSMPLAACDLSKCGQLSISDCANMLHATASALVYAHTTGVMHCDIKPQNILVFMENDKKTFKLADFGIAQFDFHDVYACTQRTKETVTVSYRAPELCAETSAYNATIDVFALGVVFLEALTGLELVHGRTNADVYAFWNAAFDLEESTFHNLQTNMPCAEESMGYKKLCRSMFFRGRCPASLGADGIDLLMNMMHPDPAKRFTAHDVVRHPFLAAACGVAPTMTTTTTMIVDVATTTSKNTSVEHAITYAKALSWISDMDGGADGPYGNHVSCLLYRFMSKVDVPAQQVMRYAYVCFALVKKAFDCPDITLEYFCPEEESKFANALRLLVQIEAEVVEALDFKVLVKKNI